MTSFIDNYIYIESVEYFFVLFVVTHGPYTKFLFLGFRPTSSHQACHNTQFEIKELNEIFCKTVQSTALFVNSTVCLYISHTDLQVSRYHVFHDCMLIAVSR